jgi:phage repressor protein C with HTH and peptisase S24 domain
MIDFWKRFESQMEALSLTKKEVASMAGINYSSFIGYATKDRIPKTEEAIRIARALGTSVEFLVYGMESMTSEENEQFDNNSSLHLPNGKTIINDNEEPTMLVPIAPQKLSAGDGVDFLEPSHYIGYIRVIERMARGLDKSCLVAAQVKGDSMTGVQIFEGDIVIFARNVVSENGIYVVSLRGDVLVKRLEFNPLTNQVSIISENKNYSPITTTADDENLKILGKVVGWIHVHPY